MKIINSKGQLFEKVSIIDVLIILILLAALVFAVSLFSKEDSLSTGSQQTITYQYETLSVPESFVSQLIIDTPVFNSSKNYGVGILKDFSVKPYELVTKNLENGTFTKEVVPEQFTVTMTVEAVVTVDQYHVWANQESIKVGTVFPIKGKGFASNGVIINVQGVQ